MTVRTRAQLHDLLRTAVRVELATIPPYLYALYSIEDGDSEAAQLIRSIVAEEMLHLALAANLLLAVGGDISFGDPSIVPSYPLELPRIRPAVRLDLAPATPEQIRSAFLALEQPDPVGSLVHEGAFDSLGEFYATIEEGLVRLAVEDGAAGTPLFGQPQLERQFGDPRFYAPIAFNVEASGDLMAIDGLAGARAAIDVIVHQGEGLDESHWADPGRQELTHYAKLLRIAEGTTPVGAIRPLPVNPRAARYPARVRPLAALFNASYAAVFVVLDALYAPRQKKGGLVNRLYGLMTHVLPPLARRLTREPIGDGLVAGPTFEPFDLGRRPADRLAELAALVAGSPLSEPALEEALTPLLQRSVLPLPD